MTVNAPPELQPWIRSTENRLDQLETDGVNLRAQIAQIPVRDKVVWTTGPNTAYANATVGSYIPSNSTVQFMNTTGLIEVTISAALQASYYGSIGAGFYLDGAPVQLSNYAPLYGVQMSDNSNAVSNTGMSYTQVFAVRPGMHSAGIFYYVKNNGGASAVSQINSSTLIVKGV